ncbi:hypothetical protein FPOAC2_14008 [Fusarium poae]|uniref:Uncharacterized protein n=1 Tax=Fusarium poae TaxID=36050 RepID=A0A1B8A3R9_FUSPO|nr:hypothetical protein FPOA_13984 [Fusarium poae]
MASRTSINWKCLHVRPQDVPSLTREHTAHVVGPSPYDGLLEIAVPNHPPFDSRYADLSKKPPVSIESMMSKYLLHMHGPVVAYQCALLNFVEIIRKGIAKHGTSLAEYYLERYSLTTPWIEYILIFDALSKIKAGSNFKLKQQRQDFVQAIVFIALSVAPPDDQLRSGIEHIGPAAVIERLQEGLEHEYRRPQPNPNLIVMVRMLLSGVGATKPTSRVGLLPQQELDFPKAIYQLMGGCQTRSLRSVTQSLIDKNIPKLGIVTWSYIPEFPCHLISSLSESALHCLAQLLESMSDLDLNPMQRGNLHKILAVSICLNPGTQNCEATHPIVDEMHKFYLRASQSLKQATGTAQMAVDLLTMVCIAQRYPSSGTFQSLTTPFCALHRTFVGGTPFTSLPAPERYISSFIEACKQRGVGQDVVNLIYGCRGTSNVSSRVDGTLVSYFSCRMDGFVHESAMEELAIEIVRPEDYV